MAMNSMPHVMVHTHHADPTHMPAKGCVMRFGADEMTDMFGNTYVRVSPEDWNRSFSGRR